MTKDEFNHTMGLVSAYQYGWDGEGSKPFKPSVLTTVQAFGVLCLANYYTKDFEILCNSNGSIDLWWKANGIELLINFNEKYSDIVLDFYGDTQDSKNTLEGAISYGLFNNIESAISKDWFTFFYMWLQNAFLEQGKSKEDSEE